MTNLNPTATSIKYIYENNVNRQELPGLHEFIGGYSDHKTEDGNNFIDIDVNDNGLIDPGTETQQLEDHSRRFIINYQRSSIDHDTSLEKMSEIIEKVDLVPTLTRADDSPEWISALVGTFTLLASAHPITAGALSLVSYIGSTTKQNEGFAVLNNTDYFVSDVDTKYKSLLKIQKSNK
jgi:hypothetical protein